MGSVINDEVAELLLPFSAEVRELALELRTLVRDVVPEATEELDVSAKLIGFTFIPGTYKGLFVAITPQRSHVNLMFSKGVELSQLDAGRALEGTGKKARHIKFSDRGAVSDPAVRVLIGAAAERTPRS
jgi:hypothetical protein